MRKERKREEEIDRHTVRGKERGIEGSSELQIERDRDRDERAQEFERAEREKERKRSRKRKICRKSDS